MGSLSQIQRWPNQALQRIDTMFAAMFPRRPVSSSRPRGAALSLRSFDRFAP